MKKYVVTWRYCGTPNKHSYTDFMQSEISNDIELEKVVLEYLRRLYTYYDIVLMSITNLDNRYFPTV